MATCKENCIHYSVCGIWDRKVFVDYEKDILSDFSDLPNVEEHCRNYFPKQIEAEWTLNRDGSGTCSNCHFTQRSVYDQDSYQRYCGCCGAKMKLKE